MQRQRKEFLEGLNKHEVNSFHMLYQRYYKPLVLFVMNFLDNEAEAEDVVEDVIVKMWEGDFMFESLKALHSYLYNSARNGALSLLRHKNVIDTYVEDEMNQADESDSEYDYSYEDMEVKFLEAVDKLPERTREVILCYLDGMKMSEIAERLGMTVGTVKTHRQRAFAKLRDVSKCVVLWIMFEHLACIN